MFHLLLKILKDLIGPLLLFGILYLYQRKKNAHVDCIMLLCRCFLLSSFGIGNLVTGCIQTFNPSYTASLLQVPIAGSIVISELGCMHLGVGVIGCIGFFKKEFVRPTVITYGIFMIGAVILHLQRLSTIQSGELTSLINDVWIILLAVLIFFSTIRTARTNKIYVPRTNY